jgi:anti-sigma factor RsiW
MRDDPDELDLHAFLDGQLDSLQEAAVLARLENDPDLRTRMRSIAEQDLLLKIAGAEGCLAGHKKPEGWAGPLLRLRQRQRGRAFMRVAAAVCLFIMGWGARDASEHWLQPRLPGYAREALASHESFAENRNPPLEAWGNRPDELRKLLAGQLGTPMEPPQLQSVGLKLVGARRTGTDDGPGSQLIYEDPEGRRVTLLVAPSEDEPDDVTLAMTEMQGYVVGFWRGQQFGYALIGREPETKLLQVAAALGVPME